MMITGILTAVVLLTSAPDTSSDADSVRSITLDEVHVVTSVKQSGTLRQQPSSVSFVDAARLQGSSLSLQGAAQLVPNLHIPDYGSRQTSAIYLRGMGSRIGTPAVGMYVDGVPYYDKSAFGFSMYNVESIEVMRGPQSTLYGRNVMGGLLLVNTRNPLYHEGTDASFDFSTRDNRRRISLSHYHRVNERLAFVGGGFYEGSDGLFRNTVTGAKVDAMQSGGGRIRGILKPSRRLTLDASLSYEYSDEGAYPYYYTGAVSSDEQYPGLVDGLTPNLEPKYRRGLLNASLSARWVTDRFTLSSVTAWQNISDRMFMDQDFLQADIYSLEQRQSINTLSEELILKNNGGSRWQWLTGISFFSQWMGIEAPVTFRPDGISWLNGIIADKMKASPMPVGVTIEGTELPFLSGFDAPTTGLALFHQSTFSGLMGISGLDATLGFRLDYERNSLDFDSWYDAAYRYTMPPRIDETHQFGNRVTDRFSNDYLQLLPRISLKYSQSWGNTYATVSRGYRSGGYNVQAFSEPMRQLMQTDMMKSVRDVTLGKVPASVAPMVGQVFDKIVSDVPLDIEGSCLYKPEYAWNYEVGAHLDFFGKDLGLDLSAFVSDVRDLQLSEMSQTGLGRIIVNAGRSRSIGVEAALAARPVKTLSLSAAYGYTNATFREYHVTDSEGKVTDCRGNHVPFMPSHTFSADAAYTFRFGGALLKSLTAGADWQATGRIWWDEENLHSQSFYSVLGARIQLDTASASLQLWGRNLLGRQYDTFWFESMGRGYSQHGRPFQLGLSLKVHF